MRDRFAIADPLTGNYRRPCSHQSAGGVADSFPEGEAARSQKSLFHTKGRLFYLQPMDVTAILWYTISVKVGRYRTMRVLGIDPGYAIVGWGVVEYISNRFNLSATGGHHRGRTRPLNSAWLKFMESVFDICKRYRARGPLHRKSCTTSTTRPPSSAWPRPAASLCWLRRSAACRSTNTHPCRPRRPSPATARP